MPLHIARHEHEQRAVECVERRNRAGQVADNLDVRQLSQPHLPVNRVHPVERHHHPAQGGEHYRTAKPQQPDQDSFITVHGANVYDGGVAAVNRAESAVIALLLALRALRHLVIGKRGSEV
jgi:hypothetical protein